MEKNEKLNVVMLAVAGLILVAVNLGVWMASQSGSIPAVSQPALWALFVVLNIVSILWAIALMGLQPLAAACAYAVGGIIAFMGVRSMDGINVAEITTAGATYGAFGMLAVCNAMVKVRLAFFRQAQVPFVFIIIGLLVLDGVINSRISHADGRAFMNAVVLPLAVGGAGVGLIWSLISRVISGRKPDQAAEAKSEVKAAASEAKASEKLTLDVPEEKTRPAARPEPVKQPEPVKVKQPEPAPAPIRKPEPVAAEAPREEAVPETPKKEESFFPLDIDKDDKFEASRKVAAEQVEEEDDEFVLPTFDSSLYSAGSMNDHRSGGVAVEEPRVSVAVESEKMEEPAKEPEPQPEEPQPEEPKAEEEEPEEKAPESEKKSDDWLGGHMDLLNKLK